MRICQEVSQKKLNVEERTNVKSVVKFQLCLEEVGETEKNLKQSIYLVSLTKRESDQIDLWKFEYQCNKYKSQITDWKAGVCVRVVVNRFGQADLYRLWRLS